MQYCAKKNCQLILGNDVSDCRETNFEVSSLSIRICLYFGNCFSRHQFNFYVLGNISRLRYLCGHPRAKRTWMINKLRFKCYMNRIQYLLKLKVTFSEFVAIWKQFWIIKGSSFNCITGNIIMVGGYLGIGTAKMGITERSHNDFD